MEPFSSSISPPSPNPKIANGVFRLNPPKTCEFRFTPLLTAIAIILAFSFSCAAATVTSVSPRSLPVSYSQHCGGVVPESTPMADSQRSTFEFLLLTNAYFTGGDELAAKIRNQQPYPLSSVSNSVSFRPQSVHRTQEDGIYKVTGIFSIKGLKNHDGLVNSTHQKLQVFHYRGPRIPARNLLPSFQLTGFWSSSSGKLCMVGSGLNTFQSTNVVFNLNYPNSSNIFTSLINGTFKSLNSKHNPPYFNPISILGVALMNYNYTLIDREIENGGFSSYDHMKSMSLALDTPQTICQEISSFGVVELESKNFPHYMYFSQIECLESGKVRFLLGFHDQEFNGRDNLPFDPNTTLISEGAWDRNMNRLVLVACRLSNYTYFFNENLIGDCSIRLSLSLASHWSLKNRSKIVGKMWNIKNTNDSTFFEPVQFQSEKNKLNRDHGLKYEYTEIENAKKSCSKKLTKVKGEKYPSEKSNDMSFDMTLRNKKGNVLHGYSSPIFVGDEYYRHSWMRFESSLNDSRILNISYVMSFSPSKPFLTYRIQISAEGTYDKENGFACMIGCRDIASFANNSIKNDSMDCEIRVNIQFPPLNSKSRRIVKGKIKSNRKKSDPLFFEDLEFVSRSILTSQAKESLWRMDLEMAMVLISNTLTCVFVGFQLFHAKQCPETLPFISIVMIVVLTSAHMIPLLLNFEALFLSNRNRRNVFLSNNGWLEVNEILVRIITMVAFLLEFRLLQLTWSSRKGVEFNRTLRNSEKKVVFLTLPLYIFGALISWFVHNWINSNSKSNLSSFSGPGNFVNSPRAFWGGLKVYTGLVLDGFLLPQILFNLFSDSKEKSLSPFFYLGTTVVRSLPRAYDFYRAYGSVWFLDYVYANPGTDYYSPAWDVIVCCGGFLFTVIICLQQRFGGRFIVPKRLRGRFVYEKVPVVVGT